MVLDGRKKLTTGPKATLGPDGLAIARAAERFEQLLGPQAVLREAQAMAAKAFGAQRTFFATNGTSTANKVIFQTLLTPGDKLLLDRNCHKSVHHGVVLSGALPVYLDSSVNSDYGLFGPVPRATVLQALQEVASEGHKTLVFSQFTSMLALVEPLLRGIGAAYAKLTGDTKDRGAEVDRTRFEHGGGGREAGLRADAQAWMGAQFLQAI